MHRNRVEEVFLGAVGWGKWGDVGQGYKVPVTQDESVLEIPSIQRCDYRILYSILEIAKRVHLRVLTTKKRVAQ